MGTVTPAPNVEYTYPYAALVDPNEAGATLCLGEGAGQGLAFGDLLVTIDSDSEHSGQQLRQRNSDVHFDSFHQRRI